MSKAKRDPVPVVVPSTGRTLGTSQAMIAVLDPEGNRVNGWMTTSDARRLVGRIMRACERAERASVLAQIAVSKDGGR